MKNNKYRLSSSVYDRENDQEKVKPHKIYFFAVEGNSTEKEYFQGVSKYRTELGIDAIVDVKVLERASKDNKSAPDAVLELLEEYVQLRENGEIEQDIPSGVLEKYGVDFIKRYLSNSDGLAKKEKNIFMNDLRSIGYDIQYRRYLSKYDSNLDEFCIFIDRDKQCHSSEEVLGIMQHCKNNNYRFFMANPCFEFWLLLHLVDVKVKYADRMNLIRENAKISVVHSFVSKEVSMIAGHGKKNIHFLKNYLSNIKLAVERAKQFASEENDLIDSVGCNLWKLMEEMMEYKEIICE